jgi:transcriptional regulator with PAS, ATPase and Fis domain
MARVQELALRAAPSSINVLIMGETGVGKDVMARMIHGRSSRADKPFLALNCAGLTESLLESELFGHVKGSFTGAYRDKPGKLESAHMGTVFLDEVGDLPLGLQAKLLRVLEEGEVRAVGSTQQKKVNVRFIAATNQDLTEKVKRNEFRKDLFFRLNVMVIQVPPLRDRTEDIPLLARHFIERYAKEFGKQVDDIQPAAVTDLLAYPWPGNVRELRNVIERAVMLAKGDRLTRQDTLGLLQTGAADDALIADDYLHLPYAKAKEKVLEAFTSRYIKSKLAANQGNVTRAATDSGMPRSYFHEIMRRYLKESD